MKALLYTNDPYEPSGVIGLYETEEQKQTILEGYKKSIENYQKEHLSTVKFPGWWKDRVWGTREEAYNTTIEEKVKQEVMALREIEIPIGVYGEYY